MPTLSPADGQRSFSSAESSETVQHISDESHQSTITLRFSENTLNEYLDSIIDGQVPLKLPLHGGGANLQAN